MLTPRYTSISIDRWSQLLRAGARPSTSALAHRNSPACSTQKLANPAFTVTCRKSSSTPRHTRQLSHVCTASNAASTANTPVAAPAFEERRTVTALFADVVGSTATAERLDVEDVRLRLLRFHGAVRAAIEQHGGVVEKFIGDAVMAVWGTPVTHEDDAERAVRAGLELVDAVDVLGTATDAPLRARCGVHTGEAATAQGADHQGMVTGDMVNTASRLQSAAEAGWVLVGESTYRMATGAIVFDDAGLLDGIPGVIVQGRYDMCTPAVTAWELHRAWPGSELVMVPDAGHAYNEPGVLAALLDATDEPPA